MLQCCSCNNHDDDETTIYVPGSSIGSDAAGAPRLTAHELPRFHDVASMSQAEKSREKERLQQLVKAFAHEAVYGVPCHVVNLASGQIAAATYVFDRQLREMKIIPKDVAIPEVCRDISRIKQTLDFADGGETWITPAVQGLLTDEQRAKLILVQFDDNSPMLCLLASNAAERERFTTCTKILRLFAQAGSPQLKSA